LANSTSLEAIMMKVAEIHWLLQRDHLSQWFLTFLRTRTP